MHPGSTVVTSMHLYYASQVGAAFGCGHSCANDDIDDVVEVIYNDAATAAEISWPSPAVADQICEDVARFAPNLAGVIVARCWAAQQCQHSSKHH